MILCVVQYSWCLNYEPSTEKNISPLSQNIWWIFYEKFLIISWPHVDVVVYVPLLIMVHPLLKIVVEPLKSRIFCGIDPHACVIAGSGKRFSGHAHWTLSAILINFVCRTSKNRECFLLKIFDYFSQFIKITNVQ